MQVYSSEVSDAECAQAKRPEWGEVGIMAKILGMGLDVGVPILSCLNVAIQTTPHPRLRRALSHARKQIQEGETLKTCFQQYIHDVGEHFVNLTSYGEDLGALDEIWLIFAEYSYLKDGAVAKQIGRDEAVSKFTTVLADDFEAGLPWLRALRRAEDEADSEFRPIASSLVELIESGNTLYEALVAYPTLFDPLYLEMVRAAEPKGILAKATRYLADA